MVILYLLLVAYILSINFYAYLLVKSLRDKEKQAQALKNAENSTISTSQTPVNTTSNAPNNVSNNAIPPEKQTGKLCITGLLGGAITIYVCMFLLKYKRTDMLLMVLMPILGVLNIYLWVLLFKSGFGFLLIR